MPRHRYKYGSVFERSLRSALLVLLVFALIWAFWNNSDNYVQRFKAEARLSDDSSMLASGQKRALVKLIAEAEAKYGVCLHVKVSPLPITSADAVPDSILVGLCPAMNQTVILMPDSWRNLLGDGFVLRLKDEVMPEFFKLGQWYDGLLRILAMLDERIGQVVRASGAQQAAHDSR